MHGLAGVLLQVDALDADLDRLAVGHVDHHFALAHHRRLVLADLVALRQVRIEIVLAVEHRFQVDARLEAEPGAHRLLDAFLVDDGQHPRHRRVDQRYVRIGLAAERGRGAREQLGLRGHLGMDLHTDDDLPVSGISAQELRLGPWSTHCHPGSILMGPDASWRRRLLLGSMREIGRRATRLPRFCRRPPDPGTSIPGRRWPGSSGLKEVGMSDNGAPNGRLGALIGALIAVAIAVFLLNGGEHLGKKTVNSDEDLPPVAPGATK